MKLSTKLI